MNLELLRHFFMWCTVINYVILVVWVALFIFAHDYTKTLNDKIIGREIAHFDSIQYAGIALYKLGIILFNFVPWMVLCLMTNT